MLLCRKVRDPSTCTHSENSLLKNSQPFSFASLFAARGVVSSLICLFPVSFAFPTSRSSRKHSAPPPHPSFLPTVRIGDALDSDSVAISKFTHSAGQGLCCLRACSFSGAASGMSSSRFWPSDCTFLLLCSLRLSIIVVMVNGRKRSMAVAGLRGLPCSFPRLLYAFPSSLFWTPLPPQVNFLLHFLFCGSLVVFILLWPLCWMQHIWMLNTMGRISGAAIDNERSVSSLTFSLKMDTFSAT